jgi:hypothetical protein
VPEFAQQTLLTLDTVRHLPRHHGHLLNWYDTQSLQALTPAVISSVDNGNLVASLWTLQEGSLELLRRPLFSKELAEGLLDHFSLLTTVGAMPSRTFSTLEKPLRQPSWLQYILSMPDSVLQEPQPPAAGSQVTDAIWFREQAQERIRQIAGAAQTYAPWVLPKYAQVMDDVAHVQNGDAPALQDMTWFIDRLVAQLAAQPSSADEQTNKLRGELLELLPVASTRIFALIEELREIAHQSSTLVDEMDFGFLLNRGRQLLSVAFELEKGQNHPACYDLLASEARIAYFVAIAKDDISQESWFQLSRPPFERQGITGLLSWTGTMFEYLMPALWMRLYPNTLLQRAAEAAVLAQRGYAAEKGVPWGISESASSRRDAAGNFHYFAFGVPDLAIFKPEQDGPVISPYSTFLALDIDSISALKNLRHMQRKNWLASYGFYESLDFSRKRESSSRPSRSRGVEPVRCWMAHHQGMSLLSIANFLHDNVVQNWFHSHPRVQATELLLQEKPLSRTA